MAGDILAPLLTAGPMCKHARDLRPLLAQIVGPENAKRMALNESPDLSVLKVSNFKRVFPKTNFTNAFFNTAFICGFSLKKGAK